MLPRLATGWQRSLGCPRLGSTSSLSSMEGCAVSRSISVKRRSAACCSATPPELPPGARSAARVRWRACRLAMLCSGGSGRVDYAALRYFDSFWPSDNTDPLQRITIQWGFSHFFPAQTIAAGQRQGVLVLSAAEGAPLWAGEIRVKGTATIAGEKVEREARAATITWPLPQNQQGPTISRLDAGLVISVMRSSIASNLTMPVNGKSTSSGCMMWKTTTSWPPKRRCCKPPRIESTSSKQSEIKKNNPRRRT